MAFYLELAMWESSGLSRGGYPVLLREYGDVKLNKKQDVIKRCLNLVKIFKLSSKLIY